MKAIIYHSNSKSKRSLKVAKEFEGDFFEIKPLKPVKNVALQMIIYGFRTVLNRTVTYEPITIDFAKYDDIILVSPVWAGRVNAYMRQFLKDNEFHDKKVRIIGNCDGGYKGYFESFKGLIDGCNDIIEKTMYVKGVKEN